MGTFFTKRLMMLFIIPNSVSPGMAAQSNLSPRVSSAQRPVRSLWVVITGSAPRIWAMFFCHFVGLSDVSREDGNGIAASAVYTDHGGICMFIFHMRGDGCGTQMPHGTYENKGIVANGKTEP